VIKAQGFEGIISLLPILLIALVSVLLRARAVRKRRLSEEAPGEAEPSREQAYRAAARPEPRMPAAQGPGAAGTPREREARPSRKALWAQELVAGGQPAGRSRVRAEAGREAPGGSPAAVQATRRAQGGYRESYVYPPPLQLNGLKRPAASAEQPQARHPADIAATRPAGPRGMDMRRLGRPPVWSRPMPGRLPGTTRSESIAARLERLPPLKRAVVWAEILGAPGGRAEHQDRL
jgi:hypothetical protein